LFQSALAPSLEYLSHWIPPALDEPSELEAIARRLAGFRDEFRSGVGFVYGILDADEAQVLGEIGLMPRIGPRALEVGYWIRIDRAGQGLATEATRALTDAGLALPEVDRIEIHCDRANAPSAAVPRKLGYRIIDGVSGDASGSSVPPGDILVFELTAPEWRRGERGS
jgi:RimJ/RimL family protein N-acetyltransferase